MPVLLAIMGSLMLAADCPLSVATDRHALFVAESQQASMTPGALARGAHSFLLELVSIHLPIGTHIYIHKATAVY